jgi:hypothetical protein
VGEKVDIFKGFVLKMEFLKLKKCIIDKVVTFKTLEDWVDFGKVGSLDKKNGKKWILSI